VVGLLTGCCLLKNILGKYFLIGSKWMIWIGCVFFYNLQATLEGWLEIMQDAVDATGVSFLGSNFKLIINTQTSHAEFMKDTTLCCLSSKLFSYLKPSFLNL
jgi:hypothetical protein